MPPQVLFLNGVCCHEHQNKRIERPKEFLNGVCRHEPETVSKAVAISFLNGVCRHEQAGTEEVQA